MERIKRGDFSIVKSELIDKTWNETDRNISKGKIEYIINTFINVISNELKKNNDIKIDGFGSFAVKVKPAYIGKSVTTGETAKIPETKYINFKPSKKLK